MVESEQRKREKTRAFSLDLGPIKPRLTRKYILQGLSTLAQTKRKEDKENTSRKSFDVLKISANFYQ